jgi:hypothetical protein
MWLGFISWIWRFHAATAACRLRKDEGESQVLELVSKPASGGAIRCRVGGFRVRALIGAAVAGLLCAGVTLPSAFGAETAPVPNFAPDSATGWLAQDDEFIPPPSGPGPVMSDPAHPYISFYKWRTNPNPTFQVADLGNPILQP